MNATAIRIRRVLPADIARVFAAWSSGAAMSKWFVCDSTLEPTATADFRVGGKYRVEMRQGDRVVGLASGEYREIKPPHRLVFTWTSEGRIGVRNSLVTIELKRVGLHTELFLVHDLSLDSPEGQAHAEGWEGCLRNLAGYLQHQP
jgi:uncharacterized protein YndB with AHSA1/START domain